MLLIYSAGSANNLMTCSASISGQADPASIVEVRYKWDEGCESDWITFVGGGVSGLSLQHTFEEIFAQQQAIYAENSTLTWEFRIDGDDERVFGESKNTFYVTYDDPLPGTVLYHCLWKVSD